MLFFQSVPSLRIFILALQAIFYWQTNDQDKSRSWTGTQLDKNSKDKYSSQSRNRAGNYSVVNKASAHQKFRFIDGFNSVTAKGSDGGGDYNTL